MKFLVVFITFSIAVVCDANLPGLPFLQGALLKKSLTEKRFTEEEAAKANNYLQLRVQQECYPSAMVRLNTNSNKR